MPPRAAAIWLSILLLASVNGAIRDLVVSPRTGDTIARALSSLVLSGLVMVVAWLSIRWIGPRTVRHAIGIGLLWVGLTLTFEFAAGRLSGKPWSVILEDYNMLRGRIWILVLIVTLLAPLWAAKSRGLARRVGAP